MDDRYWGEERKCSNGNGNKEGKGGKKDNRNMETKVMQMERIKRVEGNGG